MQHYVFIIVGVNKKMKCAKFKRFLPLFLEGQLSPKQSLEIKAHLDKCADCSKEVVFLKETWDLIEEYKPAVSSPNFKANFWKRLAEEELSFEKKKVFIFPGVRLRLIPVFTALAAILIFSSVYLANYFSEKNIQRLAMAIDDKDIVMLKNLDLAEDLDVIENIRILEDLKVIDLVEL